MFISLSRLLFKNTNGKVAAKFKTLRHKKPLLEMHLLTTSRYRKVTVFLAYIFVSIALLGSASSEINESNVLRTISSINSNFSLLNTNCEIDIKNSLNILKELNK